jgi:hypothetical protein
MDHTNDDDFRGGGMHCAEDDSNGEEEEDMYFNERNTLAKGEAAHAMTLLPEDFVPDGNSVICGRGRRIFMHPGNER